MNYFVMFLGLLSSVTGILLISAFLCFLDRRRNSYYTDGKQKVRIVRENVYYDTTTGKKMTIVVYQDDKKRLFALDRELFLRTFVPIKEK